MSNEELVARTISAHKRRCSLSHPDVDRTWTSYVGQARAVLAALAAPETRSPAADVVERAAWAIAEAIAKRHGSGHTASNWMSEARREAALAALDAAEPAIRRDEAEKCARVAESYHRTDDFGEFYRGNDVAAALRARHSEPHTDQTGGK